MFIPGETQKTLRWTRNPNLDHAQGYYYNTDDNWVVTRTVSGSDVSFVATSPTGVKYFFDHYIDDPDLKGRGVVAATRIEDVHGNWVDYNYSGLQPTSITSNDGLSRLWSTRLARSPINMSIPRSGSRNR